MDEINLTDDGSLPVRVQRADGSEQVFQLDLLAAKLAFEDVEKKHQIKKGSIVTPELMADCAKAAIRVGLTDCSPTLGFRLYGAVNDRWMSLKKSLENTPGSPDTTASTPSNSAASNGLASSPISAPSKPKRKSRRKT